MWSSHRLLAFARVWYLINYIIKPKIQTNETNKIHLILWHIVDVVFYWLYQFLFLSVSYTIFICICSDLKPDYIFHKHIKEKCFFKKMLPWSLGLRIVTLSHFFATTILIRYTMNISWNQNTSKRKEREKRFDKTKENNDTNNNNKMH